MRSRLHFFAARFHSAQGVVAQNDIGVVGADV
ncbi:hypothetical protein MCEGEM3_01522 [Oxalobacteraceae bacterium]|jgi:hypothetical protein